VRRQGVRYDRCWGILQEMSSERLAASAISSAIEIEKSAKAGKRTENAGEDSKTLNR
jgi:hypothetical protein